MSTDGFIVNRESTFELVEQWLSSYVTQPHEEIGRPGAVCPFVAPARKADALRMAARFVGSDVSLSRVTQIVRDGIDNFEQDDWGSVNPALRSLLLVFPDLPREAFSLLDDAHSLLKSECVERGLMIGQFHPQCAEPAARNPAFPVSRSPVPLVAIRFMAVHDILFLSERPSWFAQYHRRFGARHRRQSNGIDLVLTTLYYKALAVHGTQEPVDDGKGPDDSPVRMQEIVK